MGERLAYWGFGIALSSALTFAIGKGLVAERGAKIVPVLCICALLCGLLLGWALDGYIAYVRLSAQRF
jgi:hypothetical protein